MGKGRSPCCDKAGVKKGAWSQAEDLKLISFIRIHGHSNWRALPKLAGLARCGKSCRLRWVNYLRPDLRRGNFTLHEEEAIIKLHKELGNKWSKIAAKFPGRTDNEIKNIWNTHLKKRVKDEEPNKKSQDSRDIVPASTSADEAPVESTKDDCSEQILVHQTNTMDDTIEHSSSSLTSHLSSQPSITGQSSHEMEILDPILDHAGAPPSSDMIIESSSDKNVSSAISDKCVENNTLDELIEIPFDSSLDLWDLLDGDLSDAADVSDVQNDSISCDVQNDSISCDDMNYTEGNGNRWWLVYLENELGLDHTESTSSSLRLS
ncbi:hypothetical protein RND81_01G210600 [Saponaria officinalis]|uniref:Uncharacterized protein n=1 Tax=Saponaria officinalis TaxID=3572 RepID=A0AAW1NHF3_SAPOF